MTSSGSISGTLVKQRRGVYIRTHGGFPGPTDSDTVRVYGFSETFHSKSKDYKALKGARFSICHFTGYLTAFKSFLFFPIRFHFLILLNVFIKKHIKNVVFTLSSRLHENRMCRRVEARVCIVLNSNKSSFCFEQALGKKKITTELSVSFFPL